MAVGTTAFPTSLDTAVELVEIKNNASSTLSGNVLIGDTTIGVVDIGEFPTTGYGTIVDDLTTPTKVEIISWTGKSGSNLTGCTRGTQGTSAAAFSSGNYIEVRPTAGHHEALRGAVIAIETKLGTGSTIAVNKLEALTASRLMVTDASGFASAASVTATEAGYLSGVTSAIQTQLGNKQGLDVTLTALAAYNTNGILTQTAADTFAGRTITGTSAKIDVSNGDGVSGNPTLTISATYAGQTSITTLGAVTTGTLSTGAILGGVTMTLGSDADGDIYYRSSGVLTRLAKGTSLQQLRMNVGATAPEWATISGGGGGDVVGPGSATDNAVVRFDSTTGKLVQDSVITIADTTGNMAGVGTLNGHTIPVGTDTFVLLTANQTLTTKTLTAPDINGGTADSLTSLSVRSTGAAFDLLFANTEVLTGNKTLTIKVNDTSRTVDLGGNLTLAAAFSTSGANALTLTTTGATNVTLPTTGTLVNSAVTSLSSLTTVGTITSGGLGTGAVIGGVTMTLGTDGTGDIYYRSAGGVLTRLAAGTNGHVLTLSSGLPAWQAAAGGGLTIGTTAITSGTAGRFLYETSGNVVGEIAGSSADANGAVQFAATARSSGVAQYFRINTPADTGQTTATESVGAYFGGNGSGSTVTRTWAAGTVTTQRENVFVAPTYAGASATATFTTAATVAITGAPIVGANAAITTSTAMQISQGGDTASSMLRLVHGHTAAGSFTNVPFGIYDSAGALKLGTRFVTGPGIWYWTAPVGAGRMGYEVGPVGGGSGLGTSDATNPTIYSQGSAIMWFNGSSGWAVMNQGYQFAFGSSVSSYDLGFFRAAAGVLRITNASTGAGKLIIGSSSASTSAADLYVVGSAAGTVPFRVDSASSPSTDIVQFTNNGTNRWSLNSSTTATTTTATGPNGGTNVTGMLMESVTLNTGGTTTDSTIDLPANSIILSVTGRVTTTITTATDWKLGDATISDRFSDANATLTAGTTTVGINQWKADRTTAGQGAFQQSTAKVRITTTGTPGAGVIRIMIYYITLSAPTS